MSVRLADNPAPPLPSDELLVERHRKGDASAAGELIRRYHGALARYLRRLVRSEELAEELQQQTWLSVLEHIEKFDGGGGCGFKAWLFRIATNKANDLWRSRGRERTAHEGLRLVVEDSSPDASERHSGDEQCVKLRRAIDRLPEAQRQVVLLRYYSGLKFIEIAELLGCPLNTALGRMHKAMLKLRQMMD